VLVGKYCVRLWILLVSHGSLAFFGLSRFDLHSVSHPPTLLLFFLHLHLGLVMLVQGGGHPFHLWDHIFVGNRKEVFDVGALGDSSVTPPST
jgi:hypothetical protein